MEVWSTGHYNGQPPGRILNLGAASRRASFACVVDIPGSDIGRKSEAEESIHQGSILFPRPPLPDDCWAREYEGLDILPKLGSSKRPCYLAKGLQAQFWLFLRFHSGFTSPSTQVSIVKALFNKPFAM